MTATVDTETRTQVQWTSGLNLMVAIWLFTSAFLVMVDSAMVVNNIVLGVIVGVLAAIRMAGMYDQALPSWINFHLGFWIVFSPWILVASEGISPAYPTLLNNYLTGATIIILACWSALATNTTDVEMSDSNAHQSA